MGRAARSGLGKWEGITPSCTTSCGLSIYHLSYKYMDMVTQGGVQRSISGGFIQSASDSLDARRALYHSANPLHLALLRGAISRRRRWHESVYPLDLFPVGHCIATATVANAKRIESFRVEIPLYQGGELFQDSLARMLRGAR